MADKYIALINGQRQQVEATVTSLGAGSAGDIPALDGTGKFDISLMPTGIGADTVAATASENLAAGDLVNLHGASLVRKADGANNRRAHGFVISSVLSGAQALVYCEGSITGLTGITVGDPYYLSATVAGQATATPPNVAGNISQEIGIGASSTSISFEPQSPILLA